MDIIDNIITYSLYSPYYVTRTSTNGRAIGGSSGFSFTVPLTWTMTLT